MKNKRIMILSIILNVILLIVVYNFATNNVKISNSTYKIKEMNESTQITDLNNQINALNTEHTDYMNYIQTCKNQIASALTNEEVPTSNQVTLEKMAENIGKIFTERTKLDSDVAATADNITQGKQAYVNGVKIIGTNKEEIKLEKIGSYTGNTTINTTYGEEKTADNFIIVATHLQIQGSSYTNGRTDWITSTINKTYNNGTLTITGAENYNNWSSNSTIRGKIVYDVYVI